MKVKLVQGSIIRIPLLSDLGYAYAKYLDLTKLDSEVSMPDVVKVFSLRTMEKFDNIESLDFNNCLLSPILVAGLIHTLKKGYWKIVGNLPLNEEDYKIPDFKGGNSTYEEIETGEWFLYKECKLRNRAKVTYDEVKFLQPFAATGTGTIEIELSMHFLLKEGENIENHFDLEDEGYRWSYKQVLDSPSLI